MFCYYTANRIKKTIINANNAIASVSAKPKIAILNISSFIEGFLEIPKPDSDRKLRGGYGSPILYTADKKTVQLTTNTRFTQADADRTLIYLIQTDFASRVIGGIGQDSWNGLNANQRAALVSYAYNVGNINKLVSSIKAKDFIKTATLIKEGPITAAGKVEEGLRLRREQEAALFSKSV